MGIPSLAIAKMALLDEMIERPGAAALRHEEKETGRPGAMRRPGIGIDEYLNDERHAEKRQGGKAGGEPEHQQVGVEMLGEGGKVRREHRRDQRKSVLLVEQIDRIVGDMP